ncbi:serine/threonine-protein kinase CTR1-like [Olea europaea var. sylvestris]|uniref:serine/threonine-protein kinase CTR1-like n=1 Tax=Olea europaea var. sylvestris TaxID=158386 RepID=UPI000C1D874C|nr:serine/threonine-protein kinase CTR1-like [Olea europaea var. sylvestris]
MWGSRELATTTPDELERGCFYGFFFHNIASYEETVSCCRNRAAEKLYEYKDYEVIGQRVTEILIDEEYLASAHKILERLQNGQCWSGQFPFKKKSGQRFMAMVTKSPLYEEGEVVGIISVSSDAAVFNNTNSENLRTNQDHDIDQTKVRGMNLKKIQWPRQPSIASVPHIASSVSNLAAKVLIRKRGDVACNSDSDTDSRVREEAEVDNQVVKFEKPPRAPGGRPTFNLSMGKSSTDAVSSEKDGNTSEFIQPSKLAAKFLTKLHMGKTGNLEKDKDGSFQQKSDHDASLTSKEVTSKPYSPRASETTTSSNYNLDANDYRENAQKGTLYPIRTNLPTNPLGASEGSSVGTFPRDRIGGSEVPRYADQLPRSSFQLDGKECEPNLEVENASPGQSDPQKFPSSDGSVGSSHGILSNKGNNESSAIPDCEIRWEDLYLREEIGQGSFAVVYRGIWNECDVAVKVYSGYQYGEETLSDCKKEIHIMRKLRHPNVVLFMGAVCSEEKLAMVTEFLPRGSLFKTLHKNNQSLDMRRRLKMALDVARGMNYLHHRNPPIVHRDLKSSNLLVDKSWTVKVGDFGLSKLKNATFLTAKSGRGTPQWMAPEVLRNEPSTEKSDIFSFGVVLWELVTESIPWNDLNSLQVVGVVGFMDRRLDLPENLDPRVSSIIGDCWQSNQQHRPSFEDIIHRMTELVHTVPGATAKTIQLI